MPDKAKPVLQRPSYWLICLLIVAITFGGGGVRYGLANLVVQLSALLVVFFHRCEVSTFLERAPLTLKVLIGLTVALPMAQLIPLPESMLANLPGREPVIAARELADISGWFPLSVDPGRTLVALTGLVLPLVVLIVASAKSTEQLITAGWFIVGAGFAAFILGVIQVMSSGAVGLLYPENPMPGVLFGTFANRNSAGLFFVGTLALAALLPLPRKWRAMPFVRIAMCALLVLAVLLTRSRSAIVLASIPIILAAMRTFTDNGLSRRKAGASLIATLAIIAAAFFALGSDNRLAQSFERFEARQDARAEIWDDASYSAQRYWPVGSGMGTFDEVFQLDEALENLAPRRAGRAHNDYLEVAVEAGLPGLALIGGWLAILIWLSWRARQSRLRWEAWAGSVILFAIAAQSGIDYPLRNQSMLAVAAFALVMLWKLGSTSAERRR